MPRWTWRNAPIDGGRAVLVDIDGVLADSDHRQHLLEGSRNWAAFFAASPGDGPLLAGITMVDLFDDDTVVILVSSRPESIHDETVAWLAEYDVRWDLLVLRSRRDHGPAADVKRLALDELRDAGFDPVLAVDDDAGVIAMYRDADVPALHIRSGYGPGA